MADILTFDDSRLVEGLKKGEEAALGQVIDKYTGYVAAVIAHVSSGALSQEDKEELTADSFFALWNNAASVRPGKLKAYLGTIARNKAKDRLRELGREPVLEEDLLLLALNGPEEELSRQEEAAVLNAALDKLPEPDRSIFIRHYYLLQKTADIAQAMDLNLNTVHTKLKRGREALRLALLEGGYFHG